MDRSRIDNGADSPMAGGRLGTDEPAAVAADLRVTGERLARSERDRALTRLDDPTPAQAAAVDDLARSLAGRLLAAPTAGLESAEAGEDVAQTARRLFDSNARGDDRQPSTPVD